MGIGQPAGEGGFNIGSMVAILAGLDNVPGVTVNRYCSSSLQTIRMAAHAIKAGEGIEAGWGIEAGFEIKAGGGIEAGDGIEAGGGIKAGSSIKAGWGIEAGFSLTAKWVSARLRIFVGLCMWRLPSPDECEVRAELRGGTIAHGTLVAPAKAEG
jgi:hypothetical protein